MLTSIHIIMFSVRVKMTSPRMELFNLARSSFVLKAFMRF